MTTGVLARRRPKRSAESVGWLVAAVLAALEIAVMALVLRLLVGWPPLDALLLALMPALGALVAARSLRLRPLAADVVAVTARVGALLLAALATMAVVVLALGRPPAGNERAWLAASLAAAAAASLFYPRLQRWLTRGAFLLTHPDEPAAIDLTRLLHLRQSQAVALEDVLVELAAALRSSFNLRSAEWWSGTSGTYERVASAPARPSRPVSLSPAQERVLARMPLVSEEWLAVWLTELLADRQGTVVAFPIVAGGELVGFVALERRRSESDDAGFEAQAGAGVRELCRQAAPLLENARLDSALRESLKELRHQAAALEASRARVVQAADTERRRIERNLHDGLQQQLVGVTLSLRLAREVAPSDQRQAGEILERLEEELERVLEELRALAHGVYPPTLRDQGLLAVLSAAARRAALPTTVAVELSRRHASDLEATVYFCCLEAMHNACKHAGNEASVSVRVWEQADAVLFAVEDDGRGFGVRQSRGIGLLNVEDRVGAVGGTVTIESAPGKGTHILGRLPVPPQARSAASTEATGTGEQP